MSNLITVLDLAIEKREEFSERTSKTTGTCMEWTARNRTVMVPKTTDAVEMLVEKAIVTFYAIIKDEKVRITAWPTSSFAQLPSYIQGRNLALTLREEGTYTKEGVDAQDKPFTAMKQFSLLKMGEGTKLEFGFEAFQAIAAKAEIRSNNTTAISLELRLSKAFKFGEKSVAVPCKIVDITKEALGKPEQNAMLIIGRDIVVEGEGKFLEGIVVNDPAGWEDKDEHGTVVGGSPRYYLVKGAMGATMDAAITAFHGE